MQQERTERTHNRLFSHCAALYASGKQHGYRYRKESGPQVNGIEEAARESALGSMTSEDPLSVPVYCDEKWQWDLFMASGNRIEWKILDDDGDIKDEGKFDSKDVPFSVPDAAGSEVMKEYISILNQRDSFAGNVFCMMDEIGKGSSGIREAMIFFDMDRLDAPTIGAFV